MGASALATPLPIALAAMLPGWLIGARCIAASLHRLLWQVGTSCMAASLPAVGGRLWRRSGAGAGSAWRVCSA
jgi:hypothetical protein